MSLRKYPPLIDGTAWSNLVDALGGEHNACLISLSTPSYIIFKDGSTYKARNGTDGGIDYSGSDAHTVINSALAALTSGGQVLLKNIAFTVTSTITVPANCELVGEGYSTIINYSGGDQAINIIGDNIKIANLKLVITAGAGSSGHRPNGIYSVNNSNVDIYRVWVYGDTSVDDGSLWRQNGIYVQGTGNYSKIIECRAEHNMKSGILNDYLNRSIISNNLALGNSAYGIYLDNADETIVHGNQCRSNLLSGIYVDDYCEHVTVTGNVCFDNHEHGFAINGMYSTCVGNVSAQNYKHGISVDDGYDWTVADNAIFDNSLGSFNTYHGIYMDALDSRVSGNIIQNVEAYGAQHDGIFCYADDILVSGNSIWSMAGSGIEISPNIDDCSIIGNQIYACVLGIEIGSGCLRTLVRNNNLASCTSYLTDNGTDTRLPTINVPFIQGSTFLSTDGSPFGWEIDADTEYAIAHVYLPKELYKIARIKIFAIGLVTETHSMTLEIVGRGGTDNEVYTQESIDIVNKGSTSTNFTANDRIYWTLTSSDDADIGDLAGNDWLEIKIKHEAADGDNCTTDACFLSIAIEYV